MKNIETKFIQHQNDALGARFPKKVVFRSLEVIRGQKKLVRKNSQNLNSFFLMQNFNQNKERLEDDKQILALQTDAIRAQLEETLKLNGDQVSQLMEDRRIMIEEHETRIKREEEKNDLLENRLRKTQELLRDTTKDFLQVFFCLFIG